MPVDFLLDSDLDVRTENGDFMTGETTEQNQQVLLLCNKGDFKENPTVCIGAAGWLKDDEPGGLLTETKKEFERDGMKVKRLDLKADGTFTINANYL
jgi:hypothetical protein